MDSNGLGMPMGTTSLAVWAPGKQRHRSCHCWFCLAQQSLCCVTEGKCQMSISPQQQVMGQQHFHWTWKQAKVGSGAHAIMCCTEQWGTGEPAWGTPPMSTGSPYLSQLTPGVQIAHFKATHTWGLWRQAKEAGAGTVLAPVLQVAVFDAILMFGMAQLAPGIYTPALAGLCPWPGWLPWHRARSRYQLPPANVALCPVPAVLPLQNPCHPKHPKAAGTG